MKLSAALMELAEMLSIAASAADQLVANEPAPPNAEIGKCLSEISAIADHLRAVARKLKAELL